MNLPRNDAERARFTARLTFFERPEIAERLAQMADEGGLSLAAEIRSAVRYWIQSWDRQED